MNFSNKQSREPKIYINLRVVSVYRATEDLRQTERRQEQKIGKIMWRAEAKRRQVNR